LVYPSWALVGYVRFRAGADDAVIKQILYADLLSWLTRREVQR
jgi:hypothetical protein